MRHGHRLLFCKHGDSRGHKLIQGSLKRKGRLMSDQWIDSVLAHKSRPGGGYSCDKILTKLDTRLRK